MKQHDSLFGGIFGSKKVDIPTPVPPPPPVLLKTIIGTNGQINYAAHGVNYSNASFRAAIKSMGMSGYRTPGGTIANSKLPTDYPLPSDIKLLYDDCGVTISFVLNMITSTMGDQLAMLLKISDSGIPVTIIELGNEFNGASYLDMMMKYNNPDNYFTECAKWIAEIKKYFPACMFGIPGGNKTGKQKRDWNQRALAKNPGAYLVWHYHNPEIYTSPDGVVNTDKIETLINTEKQVEFAGIDASRLMVTEFNLRNEDSTIQPVFKDDAQKAIAVKYMMQKFYNMGCPVILFHNITQAEGNGCVDITATGSSLSATGLAIREFINSVV